MSEQHRPFSSSTLSLLCHWSFQGLRHESETRGHIQVPYAPWGTIKVSEASLKPLSLGGASTGTPTPLELSLKITFKLPALPGFSNFAQRLQVGSQLNGFSPLPSHALQSHTLLLFWSPLKRIVKILHFNILLLFLAKRLVKVIHENASHKDIQY